MFTHILWNACKGKLGNLSAFAHYSVVHIHNFVSTHEEARVVKTMTQMGMLMVLRVLLPIQDLSLSIPHPRIWQDSRPPIWPILKHNLVTQVLLQVTAACTWQISLCILCKVGQIISLHRNPRKTYPDLLWNLKKEIYCLNFELLSTQYLLSCNFLMACYFI